MRLLLKNWHKFMNREDLPWVKLVWEKYYPNHKFPGQIKKGSFWWRDLLKLLESFKGMATVTVKDGRTCSFWEDMWCNRIPKTWYPELFSFTKNAVISVSKVRSLPHLHHLFHVPLTEEAFHQYIELQEILDLLPENGASSCFWRDPDAQFCVICGDDKENHLELMCPYNYLSPESYVPCRARLALWGNYTTTLRYKCPRHNEEEQRTPPTHDETNSRRLTFMRCLVRVNNLPEWYPTEQLVELFSRFGPLRMWYVPTRSYGACKGYGCVAFQDHGHAEEAVEALNCWEFGGHKLRVDWAYPCLNC